MQKDFQRLLSDSAFLRKQRRVRSKSVGTKVTEEEFRELLSRAGDHKLSQWVRAQLLKPDEAAADVAALLSEVIGLRTIVVNVIFALANGHGIAVDQMRTLIERADQEKASQATARLAVVRGRRNS
jgi:hypothetical protein